MSSSVALRTFPSYHPHPCLQNVCIVPHGTSVPMKQPRPSSLHSASCLSGPEASRTSCERNHTTFVLGIRLISPSTASSGFSRRLPGFLPLSAEQHSWVGRLRWVTRRPTRGQCGCFHLLGAVTSTGTGGSEQGGQRHAAWVVWADLTREDGLEEG